MRPSFANWLQENQSLVAVASPVGAALSGLGLRYAPNGYWIVAALVGIAFFAAAPAMAGRLNRLQQTRQAQQKCVKELLEACAHSFGYPARHVRVNIMRFSQDRRIRKVDATTAFNMDEDPDQELAVDATAGASGQAAQKRRPAIADLSLPLQPGGPDWGLSPATLAQIRRSLQSILSVPVFDPRNADGPLLATLQIDSDLPLSDAGFDQEEMRQQAERFADVLSLLLEQDK